MFNSISTTNVYIPLFYSLLLLEPNSWQKQTKEEFSGFTVLEDSAYGLLAKELRKQELARQSCV